LISKAGTLLVTGSVYGKGISPANAAVLPAGVFVVAPPELGDPGAVGESA
jgi:hypothetical protein